MTMDEKNLEGSEQTRPERKPYAPPRIEESGRYEHMVLNCSLAPEGAGCFEEEFGERSMF